mmetsp:Transcript_26442/g.71419  ORF Transcript_26442/g.71419 Transcript_26442/m.71419 type:complete len:307 (+) Transcript_26442:5405-6325(+)
MMVVDSTAAAVDPVAATTAGVLSTTTRRCHEHANTIFRSQQGRRLDAMERIAALEQEKCAEHMADLVALFGQRGVRGDQARSLAEGGEEAACARIRERHDACPARVFVALLGQDQSRRASIHIARPDAPDPGVHVEVGDELFASDIEGARSEHVERVLEEVSRYPIQPEGAKELQLVALEVDAAEGPVNLRLIQDGHEQAVKSEHVFGALEEDSCGFLEAIGARAVAQVVPPPVLHGANFRACSPRAERHCVHARINHVVVAQLARGKRGEVACLEVGSRVGVGSCAREAHGSQHGGCSTPVSSAK